MLLRLFGLAEWSYGKYNYVSIAYNRLRLSFFQFPKVGITIGYGTCGNGHFV